VKVGVLGAGQLARMLALAAHPLGLKVAAYDPALESCATAVCAVTRAAFEDAVQLQAFCAAHDVVTFDFENVPVAALAVLNNQSALRPNLQALEAAQDRISEKQLFERLGIPTPRYFEISTVAQLRSAIVQLNGCGILKTRRLGYDGRGQVRIEPSSDAALAFSSIACAPAILEQFVPFSYEVSQIAVRAISGEIRFYPLIANVHRAGVLHLSCSPWASTKLSGQAQAHVAKLLLELDYVGVLAVEFFVVEGELVANEMAPRVHNSGHLTIEGNVTSQFENHLRAIADLPLGSTDARGMSCMLNFLGEMPDPRAFLSGSGAHWHDYGKTARSGRKVGHVTICASNKTELLERAEALGVNALHALLEQAENA